MKTLHGRLAITSSGIAFAKDQLKKGLGLFHNLDQSMVNVDDSDSESYCSDEDNVHDDCDELAFESEDSEHYFIDEDEDTFS